MALKTFNPTSPSRRALVQVDRSDLYKGKPEKALTEGQSKKGGRNNSGRITMRRQGGGHKQSYRIIDFKRSKADVPATVLNLQYDPNRTSFIALIEYADGEKTYIIAPQRLQAGDKVISGQSVDVKPGNAMPLKTIPIGTVVHCVELKPGKGAQLARSAGASVQYIGREGKYAQIRLRSGEMRKVLIDCRATIGSVGNAEHNLRKLGKAGAKRWRGIRPTVRGVAMNPVDHPHGGGEGRTSGGRHPCSPWGVPTKGYRTRVNKRSNNMIIRRRKK